jgi:HSP20 family protein
MNRQVTVFDPFRMISSDFFDRPFREFFSNMGEELAVDVSEDDDKIYVRLSVPGFNKDNIDINVEDRLLTVSGKIETIVESNDKKRFHRREINLQSFTKSVTLPTIVQSDSAKAVFKDGMLNIELPKAPEVKPKKISISAD